MSKSDILGIISLIGFLCVLYLLVGCTNRPAIMKQQKDCVKVNIEKMVTNYLCLDVGGDVRERIP